MVGVRHAERSENCNFQRLHFLGLGILLVVVTQQMEHAVHGQVGPVIPQRFSLHAGFFGHCLTGAPSLPESLLDKQIYKDVRNVTEEDLDKRAEELHEMNPMMGHRGVRLGITFPEISEMQFRAILESAAELRQEIEDRVRTLTEASYEEDGRGVGRFRFRADGFLTYMVRNLVGTLLEIGRGRMPAERIVEILISRDRGLAGPTAAARGPASSPGWPSSSIRSPTRP